MIYHAAARSKKIFQFIIVSGALLFYLAAAGLWLWWAPAVEALHDPMLFTGRSAIWQAEVAFICDHPWLGSGFGSFSYTAQNSPIAQYIDNAWVGSVASGHNGYLELLVTLGIPGFALAIYGLVVEPAICFCGKSTLNLSTRAFLFTIYAFFLLHNFTETIFLKTDAPEWVVYLLTIAALRSGRVKSTAMSSSPSSVSLSPVFNRAGVIGDAIRSVLNQSYQDFEIVVVDDGSTDDIEKTMQSFDDLRNSFNRQENRGGGAARNRGIDLSHGRFVAFLDSDDRFLPGHLEQMKHLLAGRSNILGYAPIIVDRGLRRSICKPLRNISPDEHMANYLLCDRGFIPTMTMAIDRDTAHKVRFPENLRSAEDTDFAIRLYLEGCTFVMAQEPGAIWQDRYDQGRSSSQWSSQTHP